MASPEVFPVLSRPARAILLAVLAVLVVLPVIAAPHLLLLDAPAHEARLGVLRDLLITGRGSPFYDLNTFFVPNIAFDLIGLGLTYFVSPEVAGRIFFAFSLLLTVSGVAVLNRVVTARWNFAPLASVLLLYNLVSILGFFSYIFGLALVPWALAGRLKLEGRAPAIGALFGVVSSILLLFCHLFAFGIYAVMSSGFALTAWRQGRIGKGWAFLRALEPVPAAILFLMMSTGTGSRLAYGPNFLSAKLLGVAKALTSGSIGGDMAFVVGAISFVLLLLFYSRRRLISSFVPGLAGLVVLYFILPAKMASGSYVDVRMLIAILLLSLAGLDVQFRSTRMTVALLALFGAAFLAKQTAIATLWRSFSGPADAVVSVLDALPAGAIIFQSECLPNSNDVLNVYRSRQPAMLHLASLSNFDDAYLVTALYAIPGQQPIRASHPYKSYVRLQAELDVTCDPSDYRRKAGNIQALMQTEAAMGHAVPPVFFLLFRPPAVTDLRPEARLLSKGPAYALYEVAK